MILPVMIFFLFYHTNSYHNSNSSAAFYASSHLAKHRRSETYGNYSLYGVSWHDSLETYNELDAVKLPAENMGTEKDIFEETSEKKSFHEVLSPLVESPHVSGRPRGVELKESFPYSIKPLQKRQLSPFLWNKQKSHPTNGIQTTRHHQSRQKRFAPPCLPPELPLLSSGETATVTKWDMTVRLFPPRLPVTVTAVAVFCCFRGVFNFEFSVSGSDIDITYMNWHDLDVRLVHLRPTWKQTYELQVTNLINNRKEVKRVTWVYYYDLIRLDVSITGDGVQWYEGPKKHDCSRYPTTTRPPPATTTKGTPPVAKEDTTTAAPAVETTTADTSTATEMANSTGTALNTATSSSLHLLWLLLVALLVVVIVAAVVVSKRRAKSQSPVQKPTSFRRESVNSMYGAAPEVRKTSINSLYGTDLSTDPSHVYANAAQHSAGHRAASGRNKAVVTGSTSWVDPDAGNAYYEASSPNYEPISPNIYHNQC